MTQRRGGSGRDEQAPGAASKRAGDRPSPADGTRGLALPVGLDRALRYLDDAELERLQQAVSAKGRRRGQQPAEGDAPDSGRRQEPGRLAVEDGQTVRWQPGQCAAEEVDRASAGGKVRAAGSRFIALSVALPFRRSTAFRRRQSSGTRDHPLLCRRTIDVRIQVGRPEPPVHPRVGGERGILDGERPIYEEAGSTTIRPRPRLTR